MEGITILAAETVSLGVPFWVAPLFGCMVCFAVLITLWATLHELDASDFVLSGFIGLFVALLFIVICAGTYKEETHYSVTIDETVPFVEFNEQYEIIDQKGDIYIVRTKEGNEDK